MKELTDQAILWLNVPVNDFASMAVDQCISKLSHVVSSPFS